MNHLLVYLVCVAGFALLALAMDRHQLDLWERELPASTSRRLRGAGFALLLLALPLAAAASGWSIGSVAWCGHLSAGAGTVLLTLAGLNRRKELRKDKARAAR